MTKVFKFNPLDLNFFADPYPIYEYLRTKEPIHKDIFGIWTITRYQDIKTVLNNPCFQSNDLPKRIDQKNNYLKEEGKNVNALASSVAEWLFYLKPPKHTRLRQLASQPFTSRMIEKLRQKIEKTTNKLLDEVENKGSMDIIAEYASPIPIITISQVLGIPLKEASKVSNWSTEIVAFMSQGLVSQQVYQRVNQAVLECNQYLRNLISDKTKNPQEDLISELIRTGYQTGKLNEEELLATCTILFGTGTATIVHLIGNGMFTLLRHPEAMEQLKQSPEIISSAVEELLRYESPVKLILREAIEDTEIGGQKIKAGETVALYLGAANRDPEKFPNPNQLNLIRSDNHHLSFGYGIHLCLGAHYARFQGQIAINTMIQRLPNLQLQTNQVQWSKDMFFRGLKTLSVRFDPEMLNRKSVEY